MSKYTKAIVAAAASALTGFLVTQGIDVSAPLEVLIPSFLTTLAVFLSPANKPAV
jgi:hypothetical protein